MKSVNIDILHVKPKYFIEQLFALQDFLHVYPAKHGFPPPTFFMTEAGGGPEIVGISIWDSVDTKSEIMEKLLGDMEYMKDAMKKSRYIRDLSNFMCSPMEQLFPMQPINPKGKYLLETFTCHGFPPAAAAKFKEIFGNMKTKMGVPIPEPTMLLMPILGKEIKLMMLLEIPDGKTDAIFDGIVKAMNDPANWPPMEEAYKFIERSSTRVLRPVEFEKLPDLGKLPDCKLQ